MTKTGRQSGEIVNNKKHLLSVVALTALAACGASTDLPRPVPPAGKLPLLVELKDGQQVAMAGSVFWDGTSKAASIPYRGKSQFKPTLILRFESPNGFGLIADYGNGGTLLPVTPPEGCDDGGGDLKQGCYGQFGLMNFDKAGDPDVVVAFGDGNMNLHVNVIRYHPPSSANDLSRSENWELIGSFEGQSQVRIYDTKLELPIGSNGAGNEFVFAQGKFLDYQAAAVPSSTGRSETTSSLTVPAATPPTRTHYTLAAGAPLCSSFKGAVTAEAVMRSGNAMAIDAVLSKHGCDTNPQGFLIEYGSSIQDLGAGVVVVNTPSGAKAYTLSDSISTVRR